jgi:ribosomal-protein-alanine N-acetyltransferase
MCFSNNPWTENMFLAELYKINSYFFTAKIYNNVVGYAGIWLVKDEAHIVNIAVHPEFRRLRIGSMLLQKLLRLAKQKGVRDVTLEVGATNKEAICFYEKFGFIYVSCRKRYYSNGEDALIMWRKV